MASHLPPSSAASRHVSRVALVLALAGALTGCSSVKRAAVGTLADTLAGGGNAYASDEDPELIRQAVPFSLKLMETTLEETPRHKALLEACCRGFTQFAYGFVFQEADETESSDYAKAEALRVRGRKLLLRARAYGLRGLEVSHSGFAGALAKDPVAAVAQLKAEEVGLAYWTAACWGAAISVSKDDPELIGQLPQVEALIDRALALDESFGAGSIHGFLISYEMLRQGQKGDPTPRARVHYERAVVLSKGLSAGPHVTWAESVCVTNRDGAGFDEALAKALAIDPDAAPASRLENILMQRRARWLQERRDELFIGQPRRAPAP